MGSDILFTCCWTANRVFYFITLGHLDQYFFAVLHCELIASRNLTKMIPSNVSLSLDITKKLVLCTAFSSFVVKLRKTNSFAVSHSFCFPGFTIRE